MGVPSLFKLFLMGTVCGCLLLSSRAHNVLSRNLPGLIHPRSLASEEGASAFKSWDGIADDDHDLVIDYILKADLDFFHNLSKRDGQTVSKILQNVRVIDSLVRGEDVRFISGVLSWLTSEGLQGHEDICLQALHRQNLAALQGCRPMLSAFMVNWESILIKQLKRKNWPLINFVLDFGICPTSEVLEILLILLKLDGNVGDFASEVSCKLIQKANPAHLGGATPLHLAAVTNRTEIVRSLLTNGYDKDVMTQCDERTLPLDVALTTGNWDMTWTILQAMVDQMSEGALQYSRHSVESVRALVKARDVGGLQDLVLTQGQVDLPEFLQDAHRMMAIAAMARNLQLLNFFGPQLENSRSPLRSHLHGIIDFAVTARNADLVASVLEQKNSNLTTGVIPPDGLVGIAVEMKDNETLELLLDFLAKRGTDAKSVRPAVYLCVAMGNLQALHLFHKHGYDVLVMVQQDELLHLAAQLNKVEILEFLLLLPGADINMQDSNGETPLIRGAAAEPPAEEAMQLLLNLGADPSIEDYQYRTAFSRSAPHISEATAKLLLEKGAPLRSSTAEDRDHSWDIMPLAQAMLGTEGVLRLLLEAGAGREIVKSGSAQKVVRSSFHCREKDICAADNMIRILFEEFTPLLSSEDLSHFFLWNALESKRTKLLQLFLKEGVDLNVRKDNTSPVTFSVRYGYCTSMELLVEFGANTGEDELSGSSALETALTAQQTSAALRLLLKYKVDPDATSLKMLQRTPSLMDFVKFELGSARTKRVDGESE